MHQTKKQANKQARSQAGCVFVCVNQARGRPVLITKQGTERESKLEAKPQEMKATNQRKDTVKKYKN